MKLRKVLVRCHVGNQHGGAFRLRLEQREDRNLASVSPTMPTDFPGIGGESRDAVAVGSSVVLFGLTPGGSLYRHDDSGWIRLGDFIAADSAVAEASGNVVMFAQMVDGALARFDNRAGWQMLGAPRTIAAIGAGTDGSGVADVFVLTTNGSFVRWTATRGWQTIGGPGTVVQWAAVPGGGAVVVTTDHRLTGFSDAFGWYPLAGAGFAQAVSSATDGSGRTVLFVQTMDQAMYQYDPSRGWSQLGASGTIASLSAGTDITGLREVYVVTTAGDFGRFDLQTGWAFVHPPGPVAEINATGLGRSYVVLTDGSIFGRDERLGFFRLSGPGFAQS